MKKRSLLFLYLLLIVCIIFLLTGCAGGTNEQDGEDKKTLIFISDRIDSVSANFTRTIQI